MRAALSPAVVTVLIAPGLAESAGLRTLAQRYPDPTLVERAAPVRIVEVERQRARFSTWYEFFPRSAAKNPGEHGTFKDCEARLADIAAMNFDVVYLPPIHPIGVTERKGPNNQPSAGTNDVGSPWAIGSQAGGHKAVHPALGTLNDFRGLVARAEELGLEIALDIAFQCSPDHPYVREHPEWFLRRPDGSIQYAENPPKKYQDIYPFNFETEAWRELWAELKSVVEFWIAQGVRIFRVDNPHTKPFEFWHWLIGEVRRAHPEAHEAQLADRRVDHALGSELLQEPLGHLEGAVVGRDLLTHQEDAVVALHLFAQGLVQRFSVGDGGHGRLRR